MKKALITGVTGQDGSYLAELLLERGYEVHGMMRRSSTFNTARIEHLYANKNFDTHYGELTGSSSMWMLLDELNPDEIYNMGAMSHVKVSFDTPAYTIETNTVGYLMLLEWVRKNPKTKIYQASSSEMFGQPNVSPPFTLDTPMQPQSPYGVSKLASYHLTKAYASGYNVYATTGILFNHETLTYNTPLIFRQNDEIDILPIGDIATLKSGVVFNLGIEKYQDGVPSNKIEVWDRDGWTKISFVSGYPHTEQKQPRIINARNMVYAATGNHVCFMADGTEKKTKDIIVGDKVLNISYPDNRKTGILSLEEAEFLGMLVGDGNLHGNTPRFTNKDINIKNRFVELWNKIARNTSHRFVDSYSGFNGGKIGQVECHGEYIRNYDIYTNEISPFGHKTKKIPKSILNSDINTMEAFLVGYNACDGLKKNKSRYRFKNFKTNSATLAAGLLFLISKVTNQKYNITVEESWDHGRQQFYYSINLLSDNASPSQKYNTVTSLLENMTSIRQIHRQTGISRKFIQKVKNGYKPNCTHHLELPNNEVKKIIDIPDYSGWFFDLATESGTFHAGIGNGLVHNSPRRGENFVSRKITIGLSKILAGVETELVLGNLDAKRDWGYSRDYMEAIHLIMQQPKPDVYIVATGEMHSVREFVEEAFSYVGLDWTKYVRSDNKYFRPNEVPVLQGDASKIKALGWEPKTKFHELVRMMVDSDMKKYGTK